MRLIDNRTNSGGEWRIAFMAGNYPRKRGGQRTERRRERLSRRWILARDIHWWLHTTRLDTAPLSRRLHRLPVAVLDDGRYQAAVTAGQPDRRPMFQRLDRHDVIWSDNTREHIDLLILATGYRATFPFHCQHPQRSPPTARHCTATVSPPPCPGSATSASNSNAASPRPPYAASPATSSPPSRRQHRNELGPNGSPASRAARCRSVINPWARSTTAQERQPAPGQPATLQGVPLARFPTGTAAQTPVTKQAKARAAT